MNVTKLLIVYRGEIALRVTGAAADMGLLSVAVHSEDDRHSLHALHCLLFRSMSGHCIVADVLAGIPTMTKERGRVGRPLPKKHHR